MLAPLKKDRTFALVSQAVESALLHSSPAAKQLLKAATSLDHFAWALEKEYYPHDDSFTMDPHTEGRRRQHIVLDRLEKARDAGNEPAASDLVLYFLLVLVDWSAHAAEGGALHDIFGAPLNVSDNADTLVARVLDLYALVTGDKDDAEACVYPRILKAQ